MNPYILIALVLGIVIGMLFFKKGKQTPELIARQAREKETNKDKILAMFGNQEKVSNDDVEKILGISDATATRYMEELEREGKIRQIGTEGRYVYYQRI